MWLDVWLFLPLQCPIFCEPQYLLTLSGLRTLHLESASRQKGRINTDFPLTHFSSLIIIAAPCLLFDTWNKLFLTFCLVLSLLTWGGKTGIHCCAMAYLITHDTSPSVLKEQWRNSQTEVHNYNGILLSTVSSFPKILRGQNVTTKSTAETIISSFLESKWRRTSKSTNLSKLASTTTIYMEPACSLWDL